MFNVCKVRNVSYNRITSPNSPNPFSARKRPICWKLVRYIHLNPLRADMVTDLNTLSAYAWCGHSRIMGKENSDWQDVDKVLGLFGKHKNRGKYSVNWFLFTHPFHIQKKNPASIIFYGTRQIIYDMEYPCSINTFTVQLKLKSSTRILLMFWVLMPFCPFAKTVKSSKQRLIPCALKLDTGKAAISGHCRNSI